MESVNTACFCPPALSIHQLAAQGELSQLKDHLRKGACPACMCLSDGELVRESACVRVYDLCNVPLHVTPEPHPPHS